MTHILLAGGGTAGHVNPLLATADELVSSLPGVELTIVGTAEGLESRLVPARGYELDTIPRLPFPRRPDAQALRFPGRFRKTVSGLADLMRTRGVSAVVGFGGYAAAPAYLAARSSRTPLVIHEANVLPGLASRLGARLTPHVGVAFAGTKLPHATVVGMPLRPEIANLDRAARRGEAAAEFGLDPDRPVLLVTGGSLGAQRLNESMLASAERVLETGYQVLHITGGRAELADPGLPGYRMMGYCDRMELALALADVAVSRSGASTVSELSALGIPALYVPYAVGNGEQRWNAKEAVDAGAAIMCDDRDFTPAWVEQEIPTLLRDNDRVARMAAAAERIGVRDGASRMVALIRSALSSTGAHRD